MWNGFWPSGLPKFSGMKQKPLGLSPVHPFPARMAAAIAFDELKRSKKKLRVLDPMVGSGTTMIVASKQGHQGIGYDMDPLAVLISKVWCTTFVLEEVMSTAEEVLNNAKDTSKSLTLKAAYPSGCKDPETKSFIRYWFDPYNRKQLSALSNSISKVENGNVKEILWCAFSRMIIKKKGGVSLAMDVSHSRPHKVSETAESHPFSVFLESVRRVVDALVETANTGIAPRVKVGDARSLPIRKGSIDKVITSPPYLNAIDYLRGHRLSLVWLGYTIPDLRSIRSDSIGSETSNAFAKQNEILPYIINKMCTKKNIPSRLKGIIESYVHDLNLMMKEIQRVLVPGGTATFVIGNSTTQSIYVKNSTAIIELGKHLGLKLKKIWIRRLPANRRYLPPPSTNAGQISNRMRTETMIRFRKPV
jgi:DNA modification methylase